MFRGVRGGLAAGDHRHRRRITVSGAAKSLAGETTRPGGARQLTYAGHPLYRYIGDTSPGATSGQGLVVFGARWDVLAPAGTEVTGG